MARSLDTLPPEVWERYFLSNLVSETNQNTVLAYTLCRHLARDKATEQSFTNRHEFPVGANGDEKYEKWNQATGERNMADPLDWEFLRTNYPIRIAPVDFSKNPIDGKHSNLMALANALQLSQQAKQLLTYVYLVQTSVLPDYFKQVGTGLPGKAYGDFVARLCRDTENAGAYSDALKSDSPLAIYGMLVMEGGHPVIGEHLLNLLGDEALDPAEVIAKIIGKPGKTDLVLSDFAHFGDVIQTMVKILNKARKKQKKGINILLYGPAGSGKTALAIALGIAAGGDVYSTGENEEYNAAMQKGGEGSADILEKKLSRDSTLRMGELIRVQALVAGNPRAITHFDEIEDLLMHGENSSPRNKVMINRLLEDNIVPTIWCGNDLHKFHSSLRQRFTISLNVGFQPTLTRHNIWKTQMRLQKVELPADVVRQLAREFTIPPRIIEKALAAFCFTDDIDDIRRTIAEAARITYGSPSAITAPFVIPAGFHPNLVNIGADQNMVAAAIAVARARKPYAMIFRTKGGMGEQELAHFMGEEGLLHVQEMRASELCIGKETPERNLQANFYGAADSNTLLVVRDLEELRSDSLMPRDADWENSIVRTFNDAVSRHSLPVILIQNDGVDFHPSTARLFVHNAQFRPLTAEAVGEMWDNMFGCEVPEKVKALEDITVGDFHAVKRRLEMTGQSSEEAATSALCAQLAARAIAPNLFGFAAIRNRCREAR